MNLIRQVTCITSIFCGLHSMAAGAATPTPAGLQVFDGDTWAYRQMFVDSNGKSHIFRPQFSVLYFTHNWTLAAINVMPGVEGRIANPDPNDVRWVSFSIPALNTCFFNIMQQDGVTQKRPCPSSLPPDSSWTEQITNFQQIRETRIFRILKSEPIVTPAGAFQPIGLEIVKQAESPVTINVTSENGQSLGKLLWTKCVCTDWYDEKVKTLVKSTCEYFNAAGVPIHRLINELEAYKVTHSNPKKSN